MLLGQAGLLLGQALQAGLGLGTDSARPRCSNSWAAAPRRLASSFCSRSRPAAWLGPAPGPRGRLPDPALRRPWPGPGFGPTQPPWPAGHGPGPRVAGLGQGLQVGQAQGGQVVGQLLLKLPGLVVLAIRALLPARGFGQGLLGLLQPLAGLLQGLLHALCLGSQLLGFG